MASHRRRSSVRVVATLAALLAGGAIGYHDSRQRYDYNAVCVDPKTNQRLPDQQCDDSSYSGSSYSSGLGRRGGWYYIPTNEETRVPGVGGTVSGGSSTPPPSSASVGRGKISTSGGTVKRSGFGSHSSGSSSVGG